MAFQDPSDVEGDQRQFKRPGIRSSIKLIHMVRDNPILYDTEHPHFRRYHKKQEVWKQIAKEFNTTVTSCKTRFKTMRDSYMRWRKDNPPGEPVKIMPTSRLAKYVKEFKFLDNIVKPRKLVYGHFTEQYLDVEDESELSLEQLLDATDGQWLPTSGSSSADEAADVVPCATPCTSADRAPTTSILCGLLTAQEPLTPDSVMRGSTDALLKYMGKVINSLPLNMRFRAKTKLFEVLFEFEEDQQR